MPADIAKLRANIDAIDDEILMLLSSRVKVCKAIGEAKKGQGRPVKDATRENQVYMRLREKSTKLGLDSVQIEAVYREIVNMCSAVQE